MKKLILLTLCSLFLFTGCGDKKEQENKPDKPTVDTRLETSNNIVTQLNQMLLENGSKQQFEYSDSKIDEDNYVKYSYYTKEKIELNITLDKKGKISVLSLAPAFDENGEPLISTAEDFKNSKSLLLQLDELHIKSYQYEELIKCASDSTEYQTCEIDNIKITSADNFLYVIMIF